MHDQYTKVTIKKYLEILRDYHDINITSMQFLNKHSLLTNSLDNEFLKQLAVSALEELDNLHE